MKKKKKVIMENIKQDIITHGRKLLLRAFRSMDEQQCVFRNADDRLLFELLSDLIKDHEEPVMFNFCGDTTEERITCIIEAIAQGKITPSQGESLMNILRNGFEITELKNLTTQLQKAGLLESHVV